MTSSLKSVKGGVCAAKGFLAAAAGADIRGSGATRDDLALIVCERTAAVAATFTQNLVKAAPVRLSMQHVRSGRARAVILNSGNANACTGTEGGRAARAMAAAVGRAMGIEETEVLVCSTGRIGVPLPVDRIVDAVPPLVSRLDAKGSLAAASAIMTSDTHPKEAAVEIALPSGGKVRIGGIAKGAGMIDPNMATMLAVLTTDAGMSSARLNKALRRAVQDSFNRITVDGDQSTNDTVILLAGGAAQAVKEAADCEAFEAGLAAVCIKLARMIVEDGEGITRVVKVEVVGAGSARDAYLASAAIARSTLVKCSWAGADPNWGRILDAAGYSGARFDPDAVSLAYDGVEAVKSGVFVKANASKVKRVAARKFFKVSLNLMQGNFSHSIWSTDLTEEYVRLNLGE